MRKYGITLVILFSLTTTVIWSQTQITGVVKDSSNQPLPGVYVESKSGQSAETDASGKYTILAKSGEQLTFSYIGEDNVVKQVKGKILNVTFATEANKIEDVVVTAQGVKREKKSLGYSIETINSDDLLSKPQTDLANSINGKVAGVNIINSAGIVGAGSSISIRGNSSINGNNQPLFIVDGIPFEGGTNQLTGFSSGGGVTNSTSSRFLDLDPNNIQSVTVLKGLAAASLYGEQGRNGVILITTKNTASIGKRQKLKVNISQSVYVTSVAKLPDYQNEYGQGGDNKANVGFVGNWGAPFSDNLTVRHHYDRPFLNGIFPQYQGVKVSYKPFKNNVRDFFRNGIGRNSYVGISSASKSSSIHFNVGYTNDEGYIPKNNLKKINIGLGGAMKFDKFTFSGALNYVNTNYKTPPLAASNATNGITIFQRLLFIPRNLDLQNLPYENPLDHSSVYYRTDIENPYWLLKNSGNESDVRRFFGNAKINYQFNKHLSLSYQAGLDQYSEKQDYFINKGGAGGSFSSNEAVVGYRRTTNTVNTIWNHNFIFNINEIKYGDFGLSGLLGFQMRQDNTTRTGISSTGQILYGVKRHDNFISSSNFDRYAGGSLDFDATANVMGLYGQAVVNYKDYLYTTFSARNDWTSVLEKQNRSIFYPSVSLSFIPTSAFDAIKSSTLSFLKIRAGYATSAGFPAAYSTRNSYVLTPVVYKGEKSLPGISRSDRLGNPDLKPELHREFEVGLDSQWFNNRISFEGSLYYRISKDQIVDKKLDPSNGFSEEATNIGRIDTKGIELSLSVTPVKTKSFSWTMENAFNALENEVSDLDKDEQINFSGFSNLGNFAKNDQPLGVIISSYALRDNQGNYLINAQNGKLINNRDVALKDQIIGDPNPDWKLTNVNTFSYKNFSLKTQWEYTHGGDFYSSTITSLLRRGVTKDTRNRTRTYVIPGFLANPKNGKALENAQGNKIPNSIQLGLNDVYFLNYVDPNSQDIYDASVLRLREISLSYSLPKKVLKNSFLTGLSFTLSGQNLWYWAPNVPKYTNFDPETISTGAGNGLGLEFGSAPSSKRYGFAINVTF